MITLDANALAAVSAAVRGVAHLVTLDFLSGLQRYTTWPTALVVGGNTYIGVGGLGQIAPIGESEDTKTDRLMLSLLVTNSALLAASIGNATEYRGRAVTISLQLMDATFIPTGAAVLRWAGIMDRIKVMRTVPKLLEDGSTSTGRIEVECSRSGMARVRHAEGQRLTHAQQQQRFPGDLGLSHVQELVERPQRWLSKKFQQV